jgi:hypothetical protein
MIRFSMSIYLNFLVQIKRQGKNKNGLKEIKR